MGRFTRWVRNGCQGVVTWGLATPRANVRECRKCNGVGALRADGSPVQEVFVEANQWPCPPCGGRGFRWYR